MKNIQTKSLLGLLTACTLILPNVSYAWNGGHGGGGYYGGGYRGGYYGGGYRGGYYGGPWRGYGYGWGAGGFALGVGVGALAAAPYYNYPYYAGYPYAGYPVVTFPTETVYVQQGVSAQPPPQPAPQTSNAPPPPARGSVTVAQSNPNSVWYFCKQANGYYPYVPSCAEGWETVPSTPPSR